MAHRVLAFFKNVVYVDVEVYISSHGKIFGVEKEETQKFPNGSVSDIVAVPFGCNDAELVKTGDGCSIIGDPTEGALLMFAEKLGVEQAGTLWCLLLAAIKEVACGQYDDELKDADNFGSIELGLTLIALAGIKDQA
eukprot:scaffold98426_cov70-Attheya_sp.AAC.9